MSMETYYKAVRPDGTDFYSGRVLWDRLGEIVEHPNPGSPGEHDARGYLSVSVSPTDCTGMRWPCRLFVVEPVEDVPVWEPTPSLPSKRASHAWRVVRELPAYEALGPNGAEVAAFLDLLPTLTRAQGGAARVAAGDAAWTAAGDAAWDAAGRRQHRIADHVPRLAAAAGKVVNARPGRNFGAARAVIVATGIVDVPVQVRRVEALRQQPVAHVYPIQRLEIGRVARQGHW